MALSGAGCSSSSSRISIYTNSYQEPAADSAEGRGKGVRREGLELFKSFISNFFNAYEEFQNS